MDTKQMKGFKYGNETIFFIEAQGKDRSFPRWRVTLYYKPHMAKTHFLPSEAEYERFLEAHKGFCYDNYDVYRTEKG